MFTEDLTQFFQTAEFAETGTLSVSTSGTAQGGSATTLTLKALASAIDDAFNSMTLTLGDGTSRSQVISDYDGATKVATVGSRWPTNLLLRSEDLTTTWTTYLATVSANAAVAPDGTTTADKIVVDATPAQAHWVRQNVTLVNEIYTFSVFLKAAEKTWAVIEIGNTNYFYCYFNLATGAIGTSQEFCTPSIVAYPNGWYRCSIAATVAALAEASTATVYLAQSDGGAAITPANSVDGIYAWGAQLEAASAVGDYIRTVATAIALPDATTPYTATGSATIQVIFDNAHFESQIGNAGIGARQPMCMVADNQMLLGDGVQRNDTLVIAGVTYKVADRQADGTGVSALMLRT